MMIKEITHAIQFLKNPAAYSADASCIKRDGFFKLPIPFQRVYLVIDYEVMRHILVKHEEKYEKSRIYWKQLRSIIGKALGSLEGDEWLALRKLQSPHFQKSNIENMLSEMNRLSQIAMQNLPHTWAPVDTLAVLNLEIVLTQIFGGESSKDLSKIHRYIVNGEELIAWRSKYPWRPLLSLIHPKYLKAKKSLAHLSSWTEHLLRSCRPDQKKLLNTLRQSYHQDLIRNELIVHLGAATETVAVTETWVLYLLCSHRQYLDLLSAEIKRLCPDNKLNTSKILECTLLEQCIKESMRLYPASHALVRDAIQDDYIKNTKVKKGDSFYISVYGIHRNPKYWEQPHSFIPERFKITNEVHENEDYYLPFGAGKHACIGKYLAMPMMKFAIAYCLLYYDLSLISGAANVLGTSTLKPSKPIVLTLKKINP